MVIVRQLSLVFASMAINNDSWRQACEV